jgi:lipopolysaccharide export LptBFGC system permease protein LptF
MSIFSFKFYSKNKLIAFRKEVISGTIIVIGISILLFCFSNWIVPKSKLEVYSTLYEMKMTAPGEAIEPVDRNRFADNHAMLSLKEINLKVDTLNKYIEAYKYQCDSILEILPDSIFYAKIERLNIEDYGLTYKSTNNVKLLGQDAKRATYNLQNSLRSLKMTISQKKKFIKEKSERNTLPVILILFFIIGASFGYLYNDQKSFLLIILALFTTTFFFKSAMLFTTSLFNNSINSSFSIILLITVTIIFLIKGLRKKQEVTKA